MNIQIAVISIIVAFASLADVRTGRIPNALTYGGCVALLIIAVAEGRLTSAALGVLAAGGILAVLHYGTGGRGLGLGDVKLAAVMGAALGMQAGIEAIAIAFVTGAAVGIIGLLSGRYTRGQRLPFAPYLAIGVYATAFFPTFFGSIG